MASQASESREEVPPRENGSVNDPYSPNGSLTDPDRMFTPYLLWGQHALYREEDPNPGKRPLRS